MEAIMGEAADTDLYERDFYAWTQVQAARLRELRGHNTIDIAHVAEEIADLGASQRNALASHVRLTFQHLILLAASPAADPRAHWAGEVSDHRDDIRQLLDTSPSLRTKIDLDKAWRRAVRTAIQKLAWHLEDTIPERLARPLDLDDLESETLSVTDLVERVRTTIAPDETESGG
jgi:hypothetical protein